MHRHNFGLVSPLCWLVFLDYAEHGMDVVGLGDVDDSMRTNILLIKDVKHAEDFNKGNPVILNLGNSSVRR